MSSQVLALKYRPQNFDEVVGQETTVQILKNAIAQKRLHHAYLFSGPRGIGKTSLARIFAKALNCEKEPTPTPCQTCVSCREITEGRSLSVMEIDGASNTSVDDVRDLREKVRYLPPGGRYKIYIIDEVHMLSTAAFNALLKTLEEPPPHVIFLFATTEPQKVPATVLSRVIRFDLRPISISVIVEQLKKIAKAESVKAADEALFQIAREAQGGLRDALSLLDQIVSFSGREVTRASVEEVVGISTQRFVFGLIRTILKANSPGVLQNSEAALAAGVDVKRLALDLLEYFRHLLVAQTSQDPSLFDLPPDEVKELAALAKECPAEDLDRLFRILQKGVTDLLRSPLPKVLFDVLLLRLCHYEKLRPLDEILKILSGSVPPTLPALPVRATTESGHPHAGGRRSPADGVGGKAWPEFLAFLRSKKPQLFSIIEQGILLKLEEKEVVLKFPLQSIHLQLLQDPERSAALKELLGQFFGRPLAVRCETSSPPAASAGADPSLIVADALSVFGPETTHVTKSGPEKSPS